MKNTRDIEDMISAYLTEILKRSLTLEKKDQIAISQEYKEWIYGETEEEDIWIIDRPIN